MNRFLRSPLILLMVIIALSLIGCATSKDVQEHAIEEAPVSTAPIEDTVVASQVIEEPETVVSQEIVTEEAIAQSEPVAVAEKPIILPDDWGQKSEITIRLIETSDLHGSIFPYDFAKDTTSSTSLMQIATYVAQERAKDQSVVLLDAGDLLQGQPLVYYYNFVKNGVPHIVSHIRNDLEHDAAAVGDHDIEAGPDGYQSI